MGPRGHDALAVRRAGRMAVPRNPPVDHLEADELAGDTLRSLPLERFPPEEVALLHLHDPAEVRLPRGDGLVDVVAVEGHARLEPQRVPRAEAARGRALVLPALQQSAEDLLRPLRREVDLEAVLAGIPGPRHQGRGSEDGG